MESRDNSSQPRTPSWGAPASRSTSKNSQMPDATPQQNPFSNDQPYQQGRSPVSLRYQRPSPYLNDHNRGRGGSMGNTFQSSRRKDDSPTFQNQGQNFSPRNLFFSQGQNFSSNNPFQSKGQNFSPSNPFQNKSQVSSPNHYSPTRPNFQSSPLAHTPGITNSSFSPRTPGSPFMTPSSRGFGYHRNNSDSSQRYGHRNAGMSNPGGSNNIQQYIHPSMLEDPWKDLPPVSMLQSY